ncbi:hypothetical protein HW555_008654 [Spodoptera exigua]|uniref:Uncharacterized protein n=1 Tax=Spodoptera exigua TaxID=7107 RepID=A0A835GDV1_SPOEX|nr:hypothetical protein HW555_008654 [Spodoptera exigua]
MHESGTKFGFGETQQSKMVLESCSVYFEYKYGPPPTYCSPHRGRSSNKACHVYPHPARVCPLTAVSQLHGNCKRKFNETKEFYILSVVKILINNERARVSYGVALNNGQFYDVVKAASLSTIRNREHLKNSNYYQQNHSGRRI